jgi:hypothetical protein
VASLRPVRHLQTVGIFGRWDCINAPQREKAKGPRFAAWMSLLRSSAHLQSAAKLRGFSPSDSGFTAETDCLLEESGFELLVPLVDAGLFGRTGRK